MKMSCSCLYLHVYLSTVLHRVEEQGTCLNLPLFRVLFVLQQKQVHSLDDTDKRVQGWAATETITRTHTLLNLFPSCPVRV